MFSSIWSLYSGGWLTVPSAPGFQHQILEKGLCLSNNCQRRSNYTVAVDASSAGDIGWINGFMSGLSRIRPTHIWFKKKKTLLIILEFPIACCSYKLGYQIRLALILHSGRKKENIVLQQWSWSRGRSRRGPLLNNLMPILIPSIGYLSKGVGISAVSPCCFSPYELS